MSADYETLAEKQRRLAADIARPTHATRRRLSRHRQAHSLHRVRPAWHGLPALQPVDSHHRPAGLSTTTSLIAIIRNFIPAKYAPKKAKWFSQATREAKRDVEARGQKRHRSSPALGRPRLEGVQNLPPRPQIPPVSTSKVGPVPKRWVIKLGTGILTDSHGHIDFSQIDQLGAQVVELRKRGHEVLIVSSGAVGCGMSLLGLKKRPTEMAELQACAALGQPRLMSIWDAAFNSARTRVAQVLLTYLELDSRALYRNVQRSVEQPALAQERPSPSSTKTTSSPTTNSSALASATTTNSAPTSPSSPAPSASSSSPTSAASPPTPTAPAASSATCAASRRKSKSSPPARKARPPSEA